MRVVRLVPKRRQSLTVRVGWTYAHLLIGLLVIIAGALVLTIAVSLLGL